MINNRNKNILWYGKAINKEVFVSYPSNVSYNNMLSGQINNVYCNPNKVINKNEYNHNKMFTTYRENSCKPYGRDNTYNVIETNKTVNQQCVLPIRYLLNDA